METTKNLIFDLGGVLIDLDMPKTEKAFYELGITDLPDMLAVVHDHDIFLKLETGDLSPDDFVEALLKQSSKPVEKQSVVDAWNALLLNFRPESLDFLEKAGAHYNIFLLSNTNAIHEISFKEQYEKLRSKKMDDLFTKPYYSHKMGLRKPDKEIFEFVLNDSGLEANETIFIDDNAMNIATAQSLGIGTLHLTPGKRVEKELAWLL